MPTLAWVLILLVVGGLLILGSARATETVTDGPVFVRWMILVFVAFLALAAIPILAGS